MAANNGFKIVQFSPELIQALTQMGELRTRINDYAVEEFKNYKGEEKLDHRDFVEMMNLSPEKSEEEQREYVRNFVRDYTSGDPQLRKKCLDDIYDRDDSFNPASLDLSCLKGTDTGPREPGGLTGSEKDFMSLIGAFRREQALSVKLKENPGYAQERYGSDSRKRAEFEARRTAMMNGLISYTDNMLRNNGFNERLHRGNVAPMAGDGEYVAADLAVNLYRNSMDRLQGGRTGENRLNFSLGPENGNIYGLSRQLAAGNLTNQMKTNAAAAFDTSLATLYRSGLPATTMNEMGVDALDLIHVDGLSARERYGNKYANLSEWEQNKMIKAEVMGAIMDGQRVDAVTLGLGAGGRMQAVTHTLEADLHAYDQMEKRSEHSGFRRLFDWGPGKIRTKADNVDRKNREDRQKEDRTGQITNSIASRLEARESKQCLMKDLGMSPKPVTPQIQRQEEKLRGIEGRIGDIEKQNFSSYEEIGNISWELERRKVYEGAREKFNKAKSKLDTTKAVMDNGNLLEVDIREVMDPIIPDYGPEQKEKLGNSYDNDFLPGYYKLDEIRTARDLSQEKLEARRDRLNASLDQEQKKNEYRLEAVNRLLDAKTPEEREKVIVMACDDTQGNKIMEVCRVLGIKIPEEIAVLGVDNDEIICSLSDPPLSSVNLNIVKGGYEAAQLIERLMRDKEASCEDVVIHPTTITNRLSTDIYSTGDPYILVALKYIHQNLATKITVEDVVRQVPLSRRLLEIHFKQVTGSSIYQYIFNLRMERFSQLLLESSEPIADIAMSVGLSDYKNLARQFKLWKKYTPAEYRKIHRVK